MKQLTNTSVKLAVLSSAAALLAACGGGGGGGSAMPVAQAPRIEGVTAVTLDQDTSSTPLKLTLSDSDTDTSQLVLTASSSDESLLPEGSLKLEGASRDRSLIVTPAADATGSAIVTLTARDPGGLTAVASFDVRVNPVYASFRTLANASFGASAATSQAKIDGVTVQADADEDPQAFDGLLASGEQ